jgi:hypothetical protein
MRQMLLAITLYYHGMFYFATHHFQILRVLETISRNAWTLFIGKKLLSCAIANCSCRPYLGSTTRYKEPLQLALADLCGPFLMRSLGGALYMLVVIDYLSGYIQVQFLRNKEGKTVVPALVKWVEIN